MSDSLTARYQSRKTDGRGFRQRSLWFSLMLAVLAICAVLAGARFITVLVLSLREEPAFTAPKTIYLPQRQLEHQMAVAEFQNAAATPTTIPSLTTESLLASTPALPAVPNVDFSPVENEALISESDELFGQSGLMGALGALSSQASSVSFLGITEEAARFVIVLDISTSVVNSVEAAGSDMEEIRDEAIRLVERLNANTLFGFVLHSRRFVSFNPNLVPATVTHKTEVQEWLRSKFNTSGRTPSGAIYGPNKTDGLFPVLNAVFDMHPDVIFLVSDGNYFTGNNNENTGRSSHGGTRGRPVKLSEMDRLIRERQAELPSEARIHTIHFPDPRNIEGRIGSKMRNIAQRTGGKYRKIEK